MKTVPAALQATLESELATLATCWKLSLTNGTDYFFTDHDVDLVIDGDTYEAASGMMPKALDQNTKLSPDNMDIVAFLESVKISENDILAGDLDYATVDIFVVDYNNLAPPETFLNFGHDEIGETLFKTQGHNVLVGTENGFVMESDAPLRNGFCYCGWRSDQEVFPIAGEIQMLVYEIVGGQDAQSILIAQSNIITLTEVDSVASWREFIFPATALLEGVRYAVGTFTNYGYYVAANMPVEIPFNTLNFAARTAFTQGARENYDNLLTPLPNLDGFGLENIQRSQYVEYGPDPVTEKLWLARGWTLGRIEIRDQAFTAEIRGKAAHLDQQLIERTTPECRANLGDVRCTIDMDDSAGTYRYDTGVVTSQSDDRRTFIDTNAPNSEDFFSGGLLTWLTPSSGESYNGGNAGYRMEVKSYDISTQQFVLFQPMPVGIEAGDEFTVKFGCNKGTTHCKDRFSNLVNFRGEPFVPGWDESLSTGTL